MKCKMNKYIKNNKIIFNMKTKTKKKNKNNK